MWTEPCDSSRWGTTQLPLHTARHQEAVGEAELPQLPSSTLPAPWERRDEGLWGRAGPWQEKNKEGRF